MKNNFFFLILMLIVLSGLSNAAVFITEGNQYDYTGTWASPLNYIDGNWSSSAVASSSSSFYRNYTNYNCDSVVLIVKDGQGTFNLSINDTTDLIPFQVTASYSDASNFVRYQYWNGSQDITLQSTYTGAASMTFFEQYLECHTATSEVLYYNFSDYIGNASITAIDEASGFDGDLEFDLNNGEWQGTLNHGEINGANVSDGVVYFDGVNDYINIGDKNLTCGVNGSSYNVWVKSSHMPIIDNSILARIGFTTNLMFDLYVHTDGTIRATFNNVARADGVTNIIDGFWHMVTVTQKAGSFELLIDGNSEVVKPFLGTPQCVSSPWMIGAQERNPRFFNGTIKSIEIFNYEINQTEITQLYNNQSVDGSILKYNFEDKNSTHVFDSHPVTESAISFNGVDEYIEVDYLNEINKNLDYSISFNAKTNRWQDFHVAFASTIDSTNRMAITFDNGGVKVGHYTGSWFAKSGLVYDNNLHNYIMTYQSTGNIINFYIDNILQSGTNTPTPSLTAKTVIGARTNGTDSFNGSISKVQIFNKALNESEITQLYNNESISGDIFNIIPNYYFLENGSLYLKDEYYKTDSTLTADNISLGEAIEFDGSTDYLDFYPIYMLGSQSYSFYAKINSDLNNQTVLGSSTESQYYISFLDNNTLEFASIDSTDSCNGDFVNIDNEFHHYIIKVSDDGVCYMYQDYVPIIMNDNNISDLTMIIDRLGKTGNGSLNLIDGVLDEFRIFSDFLTTQQIYSLYYFNEVDFPSEYTVFYAKHILTNESFDNFTITWYNKDLATTGSISTNDGFVILNLNDSFDYEINITSPYFANAYNNTFDSTLNNYTFYVYDNNSVSIYIYDEETNNLLSGVNVTLQYMINGYYNYETNNTGDFYLKNLISGFYEFKLSSIDYYYRFYYIDLMDSNHYLLNAYILDTTNGALRSFIAQCTGSAVRNATISIYKLINGNYVTIAQRLTDYTGLAPFYLNPATTYKIIITTEDYTTFTSSITPSSSPIAFDLCGEGSAQPFNWTTLYDLFSYLIDEETLINASLHTFNLDASSPSGSIVSFGLTADGSTSIVTGSPAGGSTSITVNLTNVTGTVPVTYMFNITGYDQYNFTKIFIIKSFTDIGNYSYTNIFEDYKDEIPTGWRYIIVTFIAVLLMTLLYKFLDPIINSFVGLFVFVTFVYFGWVSVVFLVPMGALLIVFYLSERGGF